jgi:hypothetical protein
MSTSNWDDPSDLDETDGEGMDGESGAFGASGERDGALGGTDEDIDEAFDEDKPGAM